MVDYLVNFAERLGLWRWRAMAFLLAFLIVVLISLTRIYLDVHYLSDGMGAMAAGLAWLAVCVTAVETLRRNQALSIDTTK